MPQTIAGFFRTPGEGEAAQAALLSAGFPRDGVSFLAGDTRGHQTPALGPIDDVEGHTDLPQGAFIGSAVGLAASIIAAFIPGIGPLIAAGPLGAAITAMTVGAGAGGLAGLLMDHGVSREEAEFFADGVARGGSLVTVQCANEEEEKRARGIMRQNGALDSEDLSVKAR